MNAMQLKRAREICGLTQADLAERVGIHQAVIAMIERGVREPQDPLLEQISSVTGFPVTFFEEYPPHEFPLGSLLYRKFSRLSSHDKTRAHRLAEQCFIAFMRMAERLRMIPLRIPRRIEEDPFTAARLVRSGIGCDPEQPINYLINRLERHGVIVFILPESIEDLDAFSTWVNGAIPVIVVSPGKPGDRHRFNIAHELAHLVLHQTLQGGFDAIEREANQFAGELLFPEESARQELIPPLTLSNLGELKPRWGMALQALIFRAVELEIINERQATSLRVQISRKGWRKKEPEVLDVRLEKPRALRKMAEVLYGDPINYKKMSEELHLPIFLTKKIIESYAGKDDFNRKSSPSTLSQIEFPHN